MSNQFQKGHVFVPNEVVDPDDLNNLVDLATSLEGIISSQPVESPPANSSEVIVRTTAGVLRRRQVSTLPTGVTSVGLTVTPTSVFQVTGTPVTNSGTLGVVTRDQLPNKLFAGPNSGTGTGPVGFRTLVPADVSVPTSLIPLITIDWSLSNSFDKILTVNTTFAFTNVDDGQTIRVRLKQDATGSRTVAWNPAPLGPIIWPGGIEQLVDSAHNTYTVFVFSAIKDSGSGNIRISGYIEGRDIDISFTATPTNIFNVSVTDPSTIALSLDTQVKNTLLAGPSSGADAVPAFRAIVASDFSVQAKNTVLAGPLTGANAVPAFRAIDEADLGVQAANTILAGPVSGADAVPSFRAITIADTIQYAEVPAHIIDCSTANVFRRILAGTLSTDTLHINNGTKGQVVKVYLIQGASPGNTSVAWTTDDSGGVIRWPGGVDHTMTIGLLGDTDIVNFFCMGSGLYYGTYDKNFTP